METFFILFVLIFVPFIWYINRAITYTSDTVGENAPLQRERTYQFSASQYFGTLIKVLEAQLLIMMPVLAVIVVRAGIRQELYVCFLLAPCFLIFAGYLLFYFYFDWQYWIITRHVTLTLNPDDQSITIDSPARYSVLTPNTVVRIEHHLQKMDNPKNPLAGYGYYLFYEADGQITQLNNIFISHIGHVEFIERFFGHVPQALIWHRLAWATDVKPVEMPDSPNFASQNQR
ncbi:hypothetical protein [Spirosoma agri]|uniref:PH domain-containing protein n=1 Tax=Spirosoma agri TaxID=1987381 RepID=A0A6M0IKD1_9BACT|nr:hypothetical protein [Spirosoma agri]NEU68624.1 hypothetical protein [Spirosoma agri]